MHPRQPSGSDCAALGGLGRGGSGHRRRLTRRRGHCYRIEQCLVDLDVQPALHGREELAFGVFGLPETYFIDAEGRIAAKHVGPLDEQTLALKLAQAGVTP